MKAFLTPLALAVLVVASRVAEPIQLSLSGGIDYSDNLEKIPNGDSGKESLLAAACVFRQSRPQRFDANYTSKLSGAHGGGFRQSNCVDGRAERRFTLNERVSVLLGHTAERLSTDPSAPNTTENETLTQSLWDFQLTH